ncbi:MAG TPA: glycosyl hydrolase [Solirubrobacterales bacterium]|jgi:hypothetical protein
MAEKRVLGQRRRRRIEVRLRACSSAFAIGALASLAAPAVSSAKAPAALYWGAQIGPQMTGESAPWDMRPVHRFQRLAGKGLSLIQFSAPFAECGSGRCVFGSFPSTPLENVRQYGAIPVFSWNSTSSPPSLNQPAFRLSRLISGQYDGFIREFAIQAREWGHPFFLRFNWEMNGFWFPWSQGVNGNKPGEYVAAWRHVHDIFTKVGATNVSWIWCPNVNIFGSNELLPLASLYPGNAYVDWTGLDGFNWGPREGSPGWLSFNEIFHRTYKEIVTKIAPSKPMMFNEIASTTKGGSKTTWIKNMFATVRRKYPKVHGIVWYDVNDRGTNWPIENSKAQSNAFRRAIRPGAFRPNIYADLTDGPIRPPA